MEVTDRRSEDEISADEFLIAMFIVGDHDIPCQLVSFKKGADSKWMISSRTKVTHPERTKTKFLNCFITAENLIFVILDKAMVLLDSALTKVKDIELTDIHEEIYFLWCANKDQLTPNSAGYLMSLAAVP